MTTTQKPLTPAQRRALHTIADRQDRDGSIGNTAAATLRILEDRGLVAGERRPGVAWRWMVLTDAGRAAIAPKS